MRVAMLLALLCGCSAGAIELAVRAQDPGSEANAAAVRLERDSEHGNRFDLQLFEKIRPLYPHVMLERVKPGPNESGKPFFSRIKQLARVRVPDGEERLVVVVGWTIPAARVDHGGGELLIYEDAGDEFPFLRMSTFGFGEPRLVDNRWLQIGETLVSLADEEALRHFERQGPGWLILGLAREAAGRALGVYVEEGREAFLARAPIREGRDRHARYVNNLPERISRFEFYPSLVEDSRYSFFKYYESWEATMLVRLTPVSDSEEPVVLEMGARGLTGGIEAHEVDLLLWETRTAEPTDRPGPGGLIHPVSEP